MRNWKQCLELQQCCPNHRIRICVLDILLSTSLIDVEEHLTHAYDFCCSMYYQFCVVLCVDCVYMFTVLLPPGAQQIAVNKYIISYIVSCYNISYRNTLYNILSYRTISYRIIFKRKSRLFICIINLTLRDRHEPRSLQTIRL